MNRKVRGFHDGAELVLRAKWAAWRPHTSQPYVSNSGRILVTTTNATEAPIKATPARIHGRRAIWLVRRRIELGPEVRFRRGIEGAEIGCPIIGSQPNNHPVSSS